MAETLILISIIFTASTIHRMFGFGFASIAIPLISLATDLEAGVLLLLFLSSSIALQTLIAHWNHVDWRLALQFTGVSIIGVVLGFVVVDDVSSRTAVVLASIFILAMALFSLVMRGRKVTIPLVPVSIAAGLSNVLSATNGPLIGLFFSSRHTKKERYLGTVSIVFLAVNIFAIIAQLSTNRDIGLTAAHAAFSFGAMLVGSYIGSQLFSRINARVFKQYALYAIIALAGLSLIQSLL